MRQSSDGDKITDRVGDSIEGMTRSQRSNRRAARHQLLHLGHRCRTMDALRAEGDVAGPIGGQWSHLFACSGWTHPRSNVAGLLHTSTPAWVITPRTASCARLVDRAGGRRQSPGSGTAPGYPCIEPVPLGHRGGSVPARAGSGGVVGPRESPRQVRTGPWTTSRRHAPARLRHRPCNRFGTWVPYHLANTRLAFGSTALHHREGDLL